jgi:hypothetical protein
MGHDDQRGMTTTRLLAYAAGILAGLLALASLLASLIRSDEAPIRVKNGSFEIHLTQNGDTWESGGGNTNEPDDGDKGDHWVPSLGDASGSDGKFWIRVNMDANVITCKDADATGRKVDITYTNGSGAPSVVTLRASKKVFWPVAYGKKHTRVRPRAQLIRASDKLLQYQNADANGYISKIAIKEGMNELGYCTFKKGYAGDICVGTSSNPTYNCK